MMATGHQTEVNFNRSLGIDEKELVEAYRYTARKVVAEMVANRCKTWPSVA